MILSTNWLAEYVELPAAVDELVERLLLSGLNHESTRRIGDDTAIEIEVTSNRPDCLGHVGVAREVSVLFSRPLHVPDPQPRQREGAAGISVGIEAEGLCPYYTARVIRGVRVGPSPEWLVARLATVGVASVNNVVDVTNYVMLEMGQPLHAFDLAAIQGGRVLVRWARAGESFHAINHKTYTLAETMGVIADARGPVALAGVMGGAGTEISSTTTDVLLESAQFAPLAVRAAARGLSLASASSYRFERGPDPAAVEWASRRAAALIGELAGGEIAGGMIEAGRLAQRTNVVGLRHDRVGEVLGIVIPRERQHVILAGLGFVAETVGPDRSTWKPPSWRRDCCREIDLVEEIARIEGYDRVPENEPLTARPVAVSTREKTARRAADVLVAAGFCEAMTRSVVAADLEMFQSPWTDAPPLVCQPPLVRGADRLRRSLLPSLLEARGTNVAIGAKRPDLFEVARGYVARAPAAPDDRPESPAEEPALVAFVRGGAFESAKGLAEAVLSRLGITDAAGGPEGGASVRYRAVGMDLFAAGRAAEIVLVERGNPGPRVGVLGEVGQGVLDRFGLKGPVVAAELRLDQLAFGVDRGRPLRRPSDFPAVERDVNLVVPRGVAWGDVEAAIRAGAGHVLEDCRLVQVWQDADRLGADRKSFVVALRLRSAAGTLSSDEANRTIDAVVAECGRTCGASLRG